jgi:toxin ParE1/3/4
VIEVHKQALAEQDLIDLWRYSCEQWGGAHADAYLDDIQAAVDRLRAHPESGGDCSHIRPGFRRVRVGAHHLYDVLAEGRINVVRVLDARRDAERHLP